MPRDSSSIFSGEPSLPHPPILAPQVAMTLEQLGTALQKPVLALLFPEGLSGRTERQGKSWGHEKGEEPTLTWNPIEASG